MLFPPEVQAVWVRITYSILLKKTRAPDGSPKDNRGPSPYVKQSLKLGSAAGPYYHNSGRPPSSLTVNAPDSSSGDNYDA